MKPDQRLVSSEFIRFEAFRKYLLTFYAVFVCSFFLRISRMVETFDRAKRLECKTIKINIIWSVYAKFHYELMCKNGLWRASAHHLDGFFFFICWFLVPSHSIKTEYIVSNAVCTLTTFSRILLYLSLAVLWIIPRKCFFRIIKRWAARAHTARFNFAPSKSLWAKRPHFMSLYYRLSPQNRFLIHFMHCVFELCLYSSIKVVHVFACLFLSLLWFARCLSFTVSYISSQQNIYELPSYQLQ